jgi:hypothetical protein
MQIPALHDLYSVSFSCNPYFCHSLYAINLEWHFSAARLVITHMPNVQLCVLRYFDFNTDASFYLFYISYVIYVIIRICCEHLCCSRTSSGLPVTSVTSFVGKTLVRQQGPL